MASGAHFVTPTVLADIAFNEGYDSARHIFSGGLFDAFKTG